MSFVHQPYQPGETIAAIATPPGEGGVAIIRISGKEALTVATSVFSSNVKNFKTHTVHFGKIINSVGETIDHGLIIPMLAPRSYTGEDTVEIQCHGGSLIARRVLEAVLQAGARAAKPGEFTFKAFMNGKLDLAQAEAVQSLICAKNEHALSAAENQLKGSLSQKITHFQKQLTDIAAILEAWVDFPEEGLEFASMEEICEQLNALCKEMQKLVDTFHDGRLIHDGISLCLVGSPNVGKSSLMNALLDKERAIVSHIPGTTRDILEDHLRINGFNIRLMDTAGIRHSDEVIEQEGIRRSKEAIQEADLILCVLDVTEEHIQKSILDQIPQKKTIVIWNKIDLPHNVLPSLDFPHVVKVSAKTKVGLEELRSMIDTVIWKHGPPGKDEILISNIRHKEALIHAIQSCRQVIQGLKEGLSPEFLSFEMRNALIELGKIIGTDITEDILSSIFSKFCIGK